MVEALSWSDREEDQLVFLSDSSLVLGVFDGKRIKRVDALTSNLKDSKAIFLSVGQSDSDPNPEVAGRNQKIREYCVTLYQQSTLHSEI